MLTCHRGNHTAGYTYHSPVLCLRLTYIYAMLCVKGISLKEKLTFRHKDGASRDSRDIVPRTLWRNPLAARLERVGDEGEN